MKHIQEQRSTAALRAEEAAEAIPRPLTVHQAADVRAAADAHHQEDKLIFVQTADFFRSLLIFCLTNYQ